MGSGKLLVVDDETDFRELLVSRLQRKGYDIKGASDGQEALKFLQEEFFDLGIFDIKMPGIDGISLLSKAKELQPDLEVIILTGHGTVATAIEAMKLGAYDYLEKPFNLAEMEVLLEKALEKRNLVGEVKGLRELIRKDNDSVNLIGSSPQMVQIRDLVHKAAHGNIPVLITGASGTGKELVARALHYWGDRKEFPFVALNAAAIPEALLESELFGYEKGAFSGATKSKLGLVEAADRGTLFLDEVGDMPVALQAKLLRFLETGEFRRIGETPVRKVNVRVVAATNRELEGLISTGKFREDLYYRLAGLRIFLPPLKDRREDIPQLVDHFLKQIGTCRGKVIGNDAMSYLLSYSYPGNVRELKSMLERACLLSQDKTLTIKDLLGPAYEPPETTPLSLAELERQHIRQVLQSTGGNKREAARILGISVRNLYRKLSDL